MSATFTMESEMSEISPYKVNVSVEPHDGESWNSLPPYTPSIQESYETVLRRFEIGVISTRAQQSVANSLFAIVSRVFMAVSGGIMFGMLLTHNSGLGAVFGGALGILVATMAEKAPAKKIAEMADAPDFWGVGLIIGVSHVIALLIVYGTAHGGLDSKGGYIAAAGFLGCFNIFPPGYLLLFLPDKANHQKLPIELAGGAKYIGLGAVSTLILVLVGLWTSYQSALDRKAG